MMFSSDLILRHSVRKVHVTGDRGSAMHDGFGVEEISAAAAFSAAYCQRRRLKV